jgi:hypothetical protein
MSQSDSPDVSRIPATRGRPFAKGNSGRKLGSKNRSTVLAAALLEDEQSALVRKAIEVALDGDVPMLKFLLDRILPRERVIRIHLPKIDFADDAVEALGQIIREVADGTITPSEAATLATLPNSLAKAIDVADAVKRLDALEAKLRERGAI